MLKRVPRIFVVVAIISVFVTSAIAGPPEVIFIDVEPVNEKDAEDIQLAAELFGVNFSTYIMWPDHHIDQMLPKDAEAIIISGRAMVHVENKSKYLDNVSDKAPSILVMELTEHRSNL
jgi:hypothetical protein